MKFFLILFILPILPLYAAGFKGRKYVEGEIIVKYKDKTTSSFQKQAIEKFGAQRLKNLNGRGLSHIRLPKNRSMQKALSDLAADPNVEYAQPNFIYQTNSTPNDLFYSREWGLKNTGQTIVDSGLGGPDSAISANNPGASGSDMKLEKAWDQITDCSSVVVAVIDTGVNYSHEDLAANMWNGGGAYPNHGYDFVENSNDPMDKNGHGTHVAGTIGAVGNNSLGGTGVCWTASIMAVRVMDASGSGTSANIIQGIDFAVANGAKVINMSLGGSSFDPAESTAITNAQASGVLVVVAAGNSTENVDNAATPMYPCKFTQSNILCVAALTQNYSMASFSSYGIVSVDVGAPGTNIVSAWPGTRSIVSDSLTSGWNFSSTTSTGWGYASLNFGTPTSCLVDPIAYDYSTAKYANSTDDRAWKVFNLNGASSAVLDFYLMLDSELDKDYLSIFTSQASGDPVVAGTKLDQYSGSSGGSRYPFSFDLTPYISPTTSIGFNFVSDATGDDLGSNISLFSISTLIPNNTTYNVINGTSMATPHVAGLAAMLFAYNPNYTYSDVINSIKNGGDSTTSLSGKTVSGRAVNAMNSLAYIQAPTGGAAVKVP